MKRLSLILAVVMFGISVGGAAAQRPPEGKTPDAGRQAVNPSEGDRTVADRVDSDQNVTWEWLSEPPGVVASASASSLPEEAECALAQVSAIKRCHDDWQRCFGTSFSYRRFLRCSNEAIVCIEGAYAAYRACVEEANG